MHVETQDAQSGKINCSGGGGGGCLGLREQMLKQLNTYISFILKTAGVVVNVRLKSPQYALVFKNHEKKTRHINDT